MSDEKLKLPTTPPAKNMPGPSAVIPPGLLKTQRASIDAEARVETARLQVAREAIRAVEAFFDVLKSQNKLESTRAEWEARVLAAETAVRRAQVELAAVHEKNQPAMEELRQAKEVQDRLLALFDDVMSELKTTNLGDESKARSREYLLQLSEMLVRLKR